MSPGNAPQSQSAHKGHPVGRLPSVATSIALVRGDAHITFGYVYFARSTSSDNVTKTALASIGGGKVSSIYSDTAAELSAAAKCAVPLCQVDNKLR